MVIIYFNLSIYNGIYVVTTPAETSNSQPISADNDVLATLSLVEETALPIPDSTEVMSQPVVEAPLSFINEIDSLLQDERLLPVVEFLQTGGPVVWILCLFSLFALTLIMLKCWQFSLYQVESKKDLTQALSLWRQAHPEQAINSLQTKRPVSAVVAYAMTGLSQPQEDESRLKDEIERLADVKIQELKSYLRPLEVVATLSPLLGLLGTVLGMIVAFQNMESAGSQVDPSVLSGGIWQALLTTAVGLAVAIPVVAIHATLERKVERVIYLMNDAVTQVFTHQSKVAVPVVNLLEEGRVSEEQNCAA